MDHWNRFSRSFYVFAGFAVVMVALRGYHWLLNSNNMIWNQNEMVMLNRLIIGV